MNNFESAQSPPAHKGGDVLTLKTLNTFAVDVITLPDEDELFWYVAKNVVGRLQFLDCVIYLSTKAPQLSRAIACTTLQYDPFTQIQRRAFRPKGILNIKKDGAVRED